MVRQATRILKNQNFNEVLSIEKSGFRFLNTDFGFPIKRGIQKQFLTREICPWISLLSVFVGNPKKDLQNCPQGQRSRMRTHF